MASRRLRAASREKVSTRMRRGRRQRRLRRCLRRGLDGGGGLGGVAQDGGQGLGVRRVAGDQSPARLGGGRRHQAGPLIGVGEEQRQARGQDQPVLGLGQVVGQHQGLQAGQVIVCDPRSPPETFLRRNHAIFVVKAKIESLRGKGGDRG